MIVKKMKGESAEAKHDFRRKPGPKHSKGSQKCCRILKIPSDPYAKLKWSIRVLTLVLLIMKFENFN